ncbi:MAG: hypothetical protein M3545_16050 [Acidobacteriota bacterium]|nr:hypothetical protein [Acidobacteriota bacterium]
MPGDGLRQLQAAACDNPRLRVLDFLPEPPLLLNRADRVIAMGGYNTVCELLAFAKPALVVPRVTPRREQWIRAERLRQLGLIDALHPNAVTPAALSEWLTADLPPATRARDLINLNGLDRLPDLLEELLTAPARIAWTLNVPVGGEYVYVA